MSTPETPRTDVDALLARVHERLGVGFELRTFPDRRIVEARWLRLYDGVVSDERSLEGTDLLTVLKAILLYEDDADRIDAEASAGDA